MKKPIYIFGAHSRARTTAEYIMTLEPATKVVGFLVSNDEVNPDNIRGIPVIDLNDSCELDTDCTVYIGTRGEHWEHISELLRIRGFTDIKPVDVELDSSLRNAYLKLFFEKKGQRFIKLDELLPTSNELKAKGIIFAMSSVYDGEVKVPYKLREYEESMQVGTVLADGQLDSIYGKKVKYYDNDKADNISRLNKQFCELTGLYAIWKMDKSDMDYVGCCHYRRHFILPDNWAQIAVSNAVDVILPVPLYVDPSLEENYRLRHIGSDLDYVYDYVEEHHPEMIVPMRKFFSQGLYSPCNMLIARAEVYDKLCEWLFPILFSLQEKVGWREDRYQNRYPGFISERLISFFFEYNRDKYKRVFADKMFIK